MSGPLVTVVLPTCGRPTLRQTLASIRDQAAPRLCEIVVVGDTHAGAFATALAEVPDLARIYDARYLAHDGGLHCVGHPQRQAGMAVAQGAWLAFSQDDDGWLAGAWETLRATLTDAPRQPHLFRVRTRQAGVVWQRPYLAVGNADADGIIVPNEPARLGQWGLQYAGDYDFLRTTVERWGGALTYAEPLIAARLPGL